MHHFDAPELLGHKVLDPEVSVYDETQSGKLARSYPRSEMNFLRLFERGLSRTIAYDPFAEISTHGLQSQRVESRKSVADT